MYIYYAIKMPSIIITYLVMLRLDCVIEVSRSSVSSSICSYFYYVDLFSVCSVGIASKLCGPDGKVRVVYVLICYCPLLCGLLILVVLDL